MIEKIIEFSAKNRFIVFLLVGMATMAGFYSMRQIPLDAIPDLSDTQVIVYSRWDRSPDIIEDQVTYPIVTAMLGAPKVKAIRGFSDFGFSYVYIIFQEGTDIYWARSRTLEYLSKILPRLPDGVQTEIGPDATGVGWVFQYALVDETGKRSLQELRSFQDWYLRYQLQAVPGVAEVAGIGGFGKQYQVNLDPNKLLAYNIPISTVVNAIRDGNIEVGGRLLEFSGAEYMVRGHGYVKSIEDIEDIVLAVDAQGVPVSIKEVATVQLGPDIRRGVADLDGRGDVVGGIVVMRYKENALRVIDRVKEKMKEIEPTLPEGMKIVVTYDRSELIKNAVGTVKETLIEELIIVCAMIGFFLLHVRSAMIPIITLPIAALIAFIPMLGMKLTSNVMSLGGIVIAIGDMVDASIVIVENAHKRLDEWSRGLRKGTREQVIIDSIKEVGPAIFSSLVVMAIAFMPVFTLEAQEGGCDRGFGGDPVDRSGLPQNGVRVHAPFEGRNDPLYADHTSRVVRHRSRQAHSDAGQDFKNFSGSGKGVWEGGPGRYLNGSRAFCHGGDDGCVKTRGSMAGGQTLVFLASRRAQRAFSCFLVRQDFLRRPG